MSREGSQVRGFKGSTHRRLVALLALLSLAAPASAHLQPLRGHLVDLTQQSELIVIVTIRDLRPVGNRRADAAAAIEAVLLGKPPAATLTFRGPTGMAAGERYAVFLRRAGSGFESAAPSGTIFPARREDDADYRRAIAGIGSALHTEAAGRIAAVRAALIPVLSAAPPALRYHAALELSALAHDHALTDRERQQLTELLANPATDPALAPLLSGVLRAAPATAAPPR